MSQRTLRSHSCNWQSWESNLGLNSWSCILSQTCPGLNIPSSAKYNLYLWEFKYTLYSKNDHSHSECLIMLKTGQITGFTHTVSFETQITNSTSSSFEARLETEKAETDFILFFLIQLCKNKNALCRVVYSEEITCNRRDEIPLTKKHTLSHPLPKCLWRVGGGIRDQDLWEAGLRGATSRGIGSLAPKGAPNPGLLPVRQQAEPQILVTAMWKVQIIIISSFPQLASRKTADSEPEHRVLLCERPCGPVPKAQETAKNQCPAVWSPGTAQPRASTLAPACFLPASVPQPSSLCSTQLWQWREIRLYDQGEGSYQSLGAPQLTPLGPSFSEMTTDPNLMQIWGTKWVRG